MFKVGATGMRYFAKSKRSRSLVLKKTFSLIGQVAFKLGYLFCQQRKDTSFEFQQTQGKVPSDNDSW